MKLTSVESVIVAEQGAALNSQNISAEQFSSDIFQPSYTRLQFRIDEQTGIRGNETEPRKTFDRNDCDSRLD